MKSFVERPQYEMTNPRADRVKNVSRLSGRSARLKSHTFRVEGPQGVREALKSHATLGPGRIQELYYDPEILERHPDIAEQISELDDKVFLRSASKEVIAAMSDAQTPQGILSVCELVTRVGEVQTNGDYAALLCGVQDPGNVGTIIRVADASGAGALIASSGSADIHNPKVVRSTVGSLFHLPLYQGQVSTNVIASFRSAGWQVLAADGYGDFNLDELQEESAGRRLGLRKSVGGIDLNKPTLWLFGNEAQGLTEEELQLADARVAVPMYGHAESLNVATAATLCLYASARAHHLVAPGE